MSVTAGGNFEVKTRSYEQEGVQKSDALHSVQRPPNLGRIRARLTNFIIFVTYSEFQMRRREVVCQNFPLTSYNGGC